MNHFMIDIETLSTDTNAHVLAICMIEFDQDEVIRTQTLYPSADEQQRMGRKIEFDTLKFWQRSQPIFQDLIHHPTKSLAFCLSHIRYMIDFQREKENIVWAKSPSFDLSILRSLFGDQIPWKYSMERDVRTACDKLTQKSIPIIHSERPHDPLSDALAQVINVQNFLKL